MNITVLYVGSSLLAPLKHAERELNRVYSLDLRVAAYNFGSPLSDGEWQDVEADLEAANIVFVIHVMDGENATRLVAARPNLFTRPFSTSRRSWSAARGSTPSASRP